MRLLRWLMDAPYNGAIAKHLIRMGQICTICRSIKRVQIEKAMLDGESTRKVAQRFGSSASAVQRHRPHIMQSLVLAKQKLRDNEQLDLAATVYQEVQQANLRTKNLIDTAEQLLRDALDKKQNQDAIAAIKVTKDTLAELRASLAFRDQLEKGRQQPEELPPDELRHTLRSKLSTLLHTSDGVIDVTAEPIEQPATATA